MNFNDWYNLTLSREHTNDKLMASEHGWDACKNEVLSILSSNSTERDILNLPSKDWYSVLKFLRQKVEKL